MQIVILAAGLGTRLGDLNSPKCLVQITPQNKYLSLQLNAVKYFDFEKKIIVGGFGFNRLKNFLLSENFSDWQLVENPDFIKANLYSLLAAKIHLSDSFFIFNADHYYSVENYKKIFNIFPSPQHITIFCDRDRKLVADDMKVLSDNAAVKQIDKKLNEFDFGYVGVTCVPKEKMEIYWQAAQHIQNEMGERAYVEAVIQKLASAGERIEIADISGSWWTEIDTPADLERARKIVMGI